MKRELPDIEIIDLDQESADNLTELYEFEESDEFNEMNNLDELDEEPEKKGFHINIHIVLLATAIIVFALILYRVMNWGNFISQEDIFSDGEGTYENMTLDSILPLLDENGNIVHLDDSDGLTIVTFGNAPFADDRYSKDNLANLIAERANATVYNCSISGSYLASEAIPYDHEEYPMDAYCFYWLTMLVCSDVDFSSYYEMAAMTLGDDTPPEAAEVIETLKSIDFNTVDAVIVMYDATDYMMNHPMNNGDYYKDPLCFVGNLAAGVEEIHLAYPHTRVIVLSPSYAFALGENGEYISSDVQRYDYETLSTYCILEQETCSMMDVSFVDNIYGTITEDNASEYLIDNLHLNSAGRSLIADRAVEALFYYEWQEID